MATTTMTVRSLPVASPGSVVPAISGEVDLVGVDELRGAIGLEVIAWFAGQAEPAAGGPRR